MLLYLKMHFTENADHKFYVDRFTILSSINPTQIRNQNEVFIETNASKYQITKAIQSYQSDYEGNESIEEGVQGFKTMLKITQRQHRKCCYASERFRFFLRDKFFGLEEDFVLENTPRRNPN